MEDTEKLATTETATWSACSEECRANDECSHWKWHNLKKTQYAKKCILMKITRVNPYESNQDIIAGPQNCTSMYLLLEYFFQY